MDRSSRVRGARVVAVTRVIGVKHTGRALAARCGLSCGGFEGLTIRHKLV